MDIKKLKINIGGYTIIEMMIAISIFLIVISIGMNGLLQSNLVLNKSRDMRNIMDNLSFVMEDMSRSIRTGYKYRCFDEGLIWENSYIQDGSLEIPRSCALGHAIAFEEATTGNVGEAKDQWIYRFGFDERTGGFTIYKSINGGLNFYPLTDSKIVFDQTSGISVLAAEPQDADPVNDGQPFVIIRLSGYIEFKGIKTPFNLQTSVSQTLIDITI
ncbi:MAG: prepilin-type N-terminal cleavage/methylation domain-containing protein [Candidatus Pacebacteria bacterium]|nr:prepilin-type N-terminal cleavage/methylation domain-containing protein [Candidatus Paceibacterota bacterium]